MVCVLETDDNFLIQQAKALLESEGIETVLPGEHFNSILPSHSLATGPLRLYVTEDDLEFAQDVLSTTLGQRAAPAYGETDDEDTGPDLYCPNCGSMRIVDSGGPVISAILHIATVIGGGRSAPRTGRKCKNCGHRW